MAEEPSLPYYWPIAGGRIIGFIPFPRVLVPCEMQSVSSRFWTRVAVSISYGDNHYTTGMMQVSKANIEGDYGHFLYFYNLSNYEKTHSAKEQNPFYIAWSRYQKQILKEIMAIFFTINFKYHPISRKKIVLMKIFQDKNEKYQGNSALK